MCLVYSGWGQRIHAAVASGLLLCDVPLGESSFRGLHGSVCWMVWRGATSPFSTAGEGGYVLQTDQGGTSHPQCICTASCWKVFSVFSLFTVRIRGRDEQVHLHDAQLRTYVQPHTGWLPAPGDLHALLRPRPHPGLRQGHQTGEWETRKMYNSTHEYPSGI